MKAWASGATSLYRSVRRQGWAAAALALVCLALQLCFPSEHAITPLYAMAVALAAMGSNSAPMTVAALLGMMGVLASRFPSGGSSLTASTVAWMCIEAATPWLAWTVGRRLRQEREAQAEDLRASAELYRRLFKEAPIAMLEEDWSGVKAMADTLVASGVKDIDAYFEAHPEFFLEARKTHVFRDANDATVRLFGARDKAHFLELAPKLLPGKPESNVHVVRAFLNGTGFAQGERVLRTLDGREVPILWQVTIPPGRADRLLFLAINVEALKTTEEALMAAQAELAHAARVAVLGELAASITHEVNQPLGAIKLFADNALRWLDRPEPNLSRARNSIARAGKSAEQASAVMAKMRQFVRKSKPETVALDMREVLNDALLLVEREASRTHVVVNAEVDSDVPLACGDRVQILQVLVNLALNAVHAVSSPATLDRAVSIHVRRSDDDHVLVLVSDTGPGISDEHLSRVFDPFFTTRSEGLGLGLAICRSIMEAHGGSIEARNGVQHGAEFSFRLPRHDPERSSPALLQ